MTEFRKHHNHALGDWILKLEDRVAVITGAGRGIGLATARRFVAEGAAVAIGEVDEELGRAAADSLKADGGKALFVPCDVGFPDQASRLIERTVDAFGRLDICVNNAGINRNADVLTATESDFDEIMRVNVKGPFFVAQAAAKEMVRTHTQGSIVNFSSIVAIIAVAGQPIYCMSKSALNGFTRMLAMTLADKGIRVNAVGPGTVLTGMSDGVLNYSNDPAAHDRMMSRTPLGRFAEPEEIAEVVLFLAGDASSYMTGQVVYPDGGRLSLNHLMPMSWDAVGVNEKS